MSVPHALRALAAGLLLVASAALVPTAAQAADGPIRVDGNALCLDVAGGSTSPGTAVITWTCNGGAGQRWELTAAGELRTFAGMRCLEVAGGSKTAGADVNASSCTGAASQRWRYREDRTIVGEASGLCLEASPVFFFPNGRLSIRGCSTTAIQRWSRPAGSSADTAAPTSPGKPTISALTCRDATVTWTAATDAVGVIAYDVYHDGQLIATTTGASLSTSVATVAGATWGFYVNARDAAGNVSQASPTTSIAIPQCAPDTEVPTIPGGLAATVSGTAVGLRWTASTDNVGVAAYDVFRDDVKVGSTAATSYTDNGLSPGRTYRYAVAARDAQGGTSAKSASVSATAGAACTTAVCAVTQVATDTDIPWGLVTLPDGSIIYARRDAGDLVRLTADGTKSTVGRVPNVQGTDGEGGLLGLAVGPGFPTTDPWLYVMHTSPTDNRVVRLRYGSGTIDPASLQVLVSGIGRNKYHNGGRLRYGPDGKLFVATGDAQNGDYAQDVDNLSGKILRLNPNGTRPSDNPFGNLVWSLGHRNPQGLAFDGQGRLWEQEFGNFVMDETNLIEKGGNYGWPACEGTFGTCDTPGFKAPKATYGVADGSCSGIAIVKDALFVACQRGQRLYRHVISGTSLTGTQGLFQGTYGRLRTVEPSRDGGLWLTTTNTGAKDSVANNSNEKILKVTLGS